VIDTDFPVEKGSTMSNLDHAIEVVDRVGSTMPADFNSVHELVAWVDSVGQSVLQDINAWQPKQAVVIQMPRRRTAKR
jgi:hypothetical protein